MLTLNYLCAKIGDFERVAVGNHQTDYSFQLDKQVRVGVVQSFVLRELMTGLDYKHVCEKELAYVIQAAFASPLLRFVQRSDVEPLWFMLLVDITTPASQRTADAYRCMHLNTPLIGERDD